MSQSVKTRMKTEASIAYHCLVWQVPWVIGVVWSGHKLLQVCGFIR